jgi:hypothetical protein
MSFEIGIATDYKDLAEKLNAWLTQGSAFGLTYSGLGDGRFTAYRGGSSSIAETFTITATSPTSFNVVGSVTGSVGPATVGTPFSRGTIAFTILSGATPFVAGDTFTISTAPPWLERRHFDGAVVRATEGNSGQLAAQNLVDGKNAQDDSRYWRVDSPTIPQDVELELPVAKTIGVYELARFTAESSIEYGPRAWDFQYWDGAGWVTLDSQSGHTAWGPNEVRVFPIASPVSADLYRLHITQGNSASRLYLGAIRLKQTTGSLEDRGDHAFGSYIWQAPGNDGASEIFCGIHMFERQDADYYNWELASFDGFATEVPFYQQAGAEVGLHLPLRNAAIPYWFVNDGRRVIVVAKVNTSYEMAILGAGLDPYFSPNQLPLPLVLGGTLCFGTPAKQKTYYPTWENPAWRYSNASNNHRMPTHSDPGNPYVYGVELRLYQLRARNVDGSWSGYEAAYNDAITAAPAAGSAIVWPYRCGVTGWDPNLDGTYQLLPVMLCHNAPNVQGRLAGIRAVSGQGLSAESLLFDGARDWLVLPNITRTDRDDWLAVCLD